MRPFLNLFVAVALIGVLVPGSTRAVGPDACPDAMSAGRDQEQPVGFPKHLDEATGSAVLQAFSDGLMEKHVDRAKIYRNWSKLKKQYLTKIVNADSERAFYDGIREFASEGLNPPVSFLSPYQRNFSAGGNGPAFGGIGGMSIPNPSGGSTVLWVFKNSPLRRAGVQPRDTLLELYRVDRRGRPSRARGDLGACFWWWFLDGQRSERGVHSPDRCRWLECADSGKFEIRSCAFQQHHLGGQAVAFRGIRSGFRHERFGTNDLRWDRWIGSRCGGPNER
jgi:hypothetical protein